MDSRSPFHPGEVLAQERAGVRSQMEKVGGVVLRDYLLEQHRAFFAMLPTLLLGGSDADGRLWASVLCGDPGFIHSPDPFTLRVDARPADGDPLAAALRPSWPLGALGLQFETRRRNRANGVVAAVDVQGFTFKVQQSFGNCPKYIQAREPAASPQAAEAGSILEGGGKLPLAAIDVIRHCDTFFIATAAAHGADVSHRGGRPGFVQIDAQGVISWPDFQGNNYFNTIGNLLADARAGLLFVDFAHGHLLHLSGRAQVQWEGAEIARFAGARRMLHFVPERHVLRRHAFRLRWSLREPSPYLDGTGIWS